MLDPYHSIIRLMRALFQLEANMAIYQKLILNFKECTVNERQGKIDKHFPFSDNSLNLPNFYTDKTISIFCISQTLSEFHQTMMKQICEIIGNRYQYRMDEIKRILDNPRDYFIEGYVDQYYKVDPINEILHYDGKSTYLFNYYVSGYIKLNGNDHLLNTRCVRIKIIDKVCNYSADSNNKFKISPFNIIDDNYWNMVNKSGFFERKIKIDHTLDLCRLVQRLNKLDVSHNMNGNDPAYDFLILDKTSDKAKRIKLSDRDLGCVFVKYIDPKDIPKLTVEILFN